MKGFASWLGWVLALVVGALALVLYNFVMVPRLRQATRMREEVRMWMNEVEELSGKVKEHEARPEVAYFAAFTFDELFTGPESFTFTRQGELSLDLTAAELREVKGTIEVTGHTDNGAAPKSFASNWEYGAARAAAVVRVLSGKGVEPERFVARSCGSTRPRDDNKTESGRQRNRRVEIAVRK